MSGHSKWHSIKHKKAAVDAKRGKLFSKVIKEIQVAARIGSGDIDSNPRLRKAVTDAKGAGMAADTIKRAIQRGVAQPLAAKVAVGEIPPGSVVTVALADDSDGLEFVVEREAEVGPKRTRAKRSGMSAHRQELRLSA